MEQIPRESSHEENGRESDLRETASSDMASFRDCKTSISTIVDQAESLGKLYKDEVLRIINQALMDVKSFLGLPSGGYLGKNDTETVIYMTMELTELKKQLREI
jgi:hypothetical protein